ncbi:MAG: YbjQ family protein [Planctomycetaceae bacterium]
MPGIFVLLFYIGPPIILFSLGYFIGGRTERRHFTELDEREQRSNVVVSQVKSFPFAEPSDLPPQIIVTEVVIGSDYLKTFLAGFRNFFGGEVKSFQTLLTRSRREALLRLTEQAEAQGYNAICNVRFDTATIGGNGQKKVHMSAVLASATAYVARTQA